MWHHLMHVTRYRPSAMHSPVTGAGDQHAQQVVGDEGEDDGGDGSARDGVAGILQLTWEAERVTWRWMRT